MTKAERTIDTPGSDDERTAADDAGADAERQSGAEADRVGGANGVQGTEGAPGADSDEAANFADEPREPTRGRRRIAVLLVVAALAYAFDLVSKLIVVEKLEHRRPIEVIGHYLQLDAVRNPGAAFGIGEAFTAVFGLIAVTVVVVIARIARKLYSLPWAIALGLLLGGALGNLTDRIFRSPGVFQGEVVDFIAPIHFAVFNLADSAIVCGGILIVLLSFRGSAPDGSVQKD